MNNERTILDLTHEDARDFFLKEKNYCKIKIPEYFTFSNLLAELSEKMKNSEAIDIRAAKNEINVNYPLFSNKDGGYSWVLCEIIHPVLYVSLVHEITKQKNWELIVNKFNEFSESPILCASIPAIGSRKGAKITNWWENVEQESIILASKYDYIFTTDITNCYGSIYTHSIEWALHTRDEAKRVAKEKKQTDKLVGSRIDEHIRCMRNGQTNGMPQGSVLMDFIAEMVLGYLDQELTKKIRKHENLKKLRPLDYKIIRYRDDYRIFVNNINTGKGILKELASVLTENGMQINPSKTSNSDDVISKSIKSDKLHLIENNFKYNDLQKELLAIYQFSKKYPNSGSVLKKLDQFHKRIERKKCIEGDIKVLSSIANNIAYRNPLTYPLVSAILSRFLLDESTERKKIVNDIKKRFEKVPNTETLNLWLQRITIQHDKSITYQGNLCAKVSGKSVAVWNSEWLKNKEL